MAPHYYNTTDLPVTVDTAGSILPGRTHADLDARVPEVKAAVDRGDLIKLDDAKPSTSTDKE